MQKIRPVSDLRNHFTVITKDVQASEEHVFLAKNGAGYIADRLDAPQVAVASSCGNIM